MSTFTLAVDVGLLGSGVAGAVPAGITDPGVALVRVRPDPGHYPAPGDDELWAGVPDVETDTSGKAAITLRVMTGGAYAVSVILAGRRIQATVPAAQTAGATVRLEDFVGLPTPGVLTDADVLRQRLAAHVTTFTATTLPAGSAATVSQVDSTDGLSHAVTLGVPQGVQGVQGERGFQGVQGETGPANALTIGTVTRVAPGGTPTATITGTAPSQTLNLGLVDGQPSSMLLSGTGSPVGVVTANPGVLYIDTAATMGAWLWRKATGTGTTGWVQDGVSTVNGQVGTVVLTPDTLGAATAAQGAKADKALLTEQLLDETLVYAMTDTNGRRSWLEIAPDGGPSARVIALLKDWADKTEFTPAMSGYSYAVVDSSGRISELALDEKGLVPQWVLDRWSSRLVLPTPQAPDIVVPSMIYALQGFPHQMIHKHYIAALSADHKVKVTNNTNGTQSLRDRWLATPTTVASTPITFSVFDRVMAQVATASTSLVVNDTTLATPCRLLPIGDSITRTGIYADQAATRVGGQTVGTRKVGGVVSEGRGGWTLNQYMTAIGVGGALALDSPFLFPVGVAPASYRGNTDFWKGVVGPNGLTDYGWSGFQQIARAGFASSGAFLYDSTGYPVTPQEGDVVVDPSLAAGSRWRQYTSGAWTTMAPQPAIEFNFSSYITRYSDAFATGNPTAISIMLGTNDFYSSYTSAAFDTFAAQLDQVIASVRAWSATVPIILCTAPVGGYQEDWSTAGVHEFEYQARMKQFTRAMITKYDTAAQRTNKVLLSSFLGSVDDEDFGTNNTVHPDAPGHTAMSQWLAGALASALN